MCRGRYESQGTNDMKVHLFAREDESARERGHKSANDLSIRFTTADAIETDGFAIDCCRLRTSSGVDGWKPTSSGEWAITRSWSRISESSYN